MTRLLIIGIATLVALVALMATGPIVFSPPAEEKSGAPPPNPATVGSKSRIDEPNLTIFLSEVPWEWATTGWVALADDNLPKLDTSFLNDVITIGGKSYDKGIGTYPLSEMVYSLDARYRLFQAEVGVDGSVPEGRGSVVFRVFLDDVLAYDSGILRSGLAARPVELSVEGVNRMRLVVEDAGDGSSLDYADWAGARLTSLGRLSERIQTQTLGRLDEAREQGQQQRDQDWATVHQRFVEKLEAIEKRLEEVRPGDREAFAVFDAGRGQIVLANDSVAVTLGYGGESHGRLDVLDLAGRNLVVDGATSSLATGNAGGLALSRDTVPLENDGYRFRRVEDPALGPGMEVAADYLAPGAGVIISPKLTLFDSGSFLTYQLELRDAAADVAVRKFSYFDPEPGGEFVLGEDSVYVTDYSLRRLAEVHDDSVLRQEKVGLGKPLVLYDRDRREALVMAIIDEVDDPALFSLQMESGRVCGRLGFAHLVPEDVRAAVLQTSPRLFLQVAAGAGVAEATEQFRRVMAALYPQPPIPDWVKYQWGTWYAFYMNYDEDTLREQIDYIAENLADLGPWSVLLDAGWYVAEGRPDSGWDKEDEDKFPNGLRAVVDYAHSRGIKVVLYFSAPYLDDREREGNWLGLRGFLEQHPDWVIRLQSDNSGSSYVYDFTNPELVQYMRELISGFFLRYDVDGIKIDGLGQAEGEQLSQEERDVFGDVNKIRMFTMDLYRLVYQEAMKAKKDAYIESGWDIPNFANQFAHTFRYGDEFPDFEHRYPAGGLLEHLDYATLQKTVLGQRPNMGMVWGGPEAQRTIRQWFEAALAMGTQMTVSTDLTRLSSRDLSALRAVLAHYDAFQGETRFVGMPFASSFGTTSEGITYLGTVNRGREARDVEIKLSDHGLDKDAEYLMYDVSSSSYSRVQGSFSANLAGSSFRLFLLRETPGVMWTNSSSRVESVPNSLKIEVNGPRDLTGFLQIYTPRPTGVRLDGKELVESARLRMGSDYSYDEVTGLLRLRYRHDKPHTVEVDY